MEKLMMALWTWAGILIVVVMKLNVGAGNLNQQDRSKRRFYIYDWPVDVVDRWPVSHTHHRLSIGPGFESNYGTGTIRNATAGLHHTHQYSLFKTFYFRLLESPWRTMDPEEASWYFVPYDLGMDSSTRQADGALLTTDCPMLSKALALLKESKYFERHNGEDHFLLHSINQMMLHFAHMKCLELYRICFNCTKLGIDVYDSNVYEVIRRNAFLRVNWLSIPFPSNFHFSEKVKVFPWTLNLRSRQFSLAFIGSDAVTARLQRTVRKAIISECSSRTSECLLMELKSHLSNVNVFSKDAGTSPYLNARLCLMPGGDFPTRKGVLDALLSGCVPVVFQKISAHKQWLVHWGSESAADDCMILMDREFMVTDTAAAFDYLIGLSHNASFISQKLEAINRIALRMQYNLPSGDGARLQAYQAEPQHGGHTKNYPKDAVDVTLEYLFGKV
jgi:hypothetical protein